MLKRTLQHRTLLLCGHNGQTFPAYSDLHPSSARTGTHFPGFCFAPPPPAAVARKLREEIAGLISAPLPNWSREPRGRVARSVPHFPGAQLCSSSSDSLSPSSSDPRDTMPSLSSTFRRLAVLDKDGEEVRVAAVGERAGYVGRWKK